MDLFVFPFMLSLTAIVDGGDAITKQRSGSQPGGVAADFLFTDVPAAALTGIDFQPSRGIISGEPQIRLSEIVETAFDATLLSADTSYAIRLDNRRLVVTPEPGTGLLLALGLSILTIRRLR